jgi:hypothetical protein
MRPDAKHLRDAQMPAKRLAMSMMIARTTKTKTTALAGVWACAVI